MNHNLLFSLYTSEVKEDEVPDASSIHENDGIPSTVSLVRKHFSGKYAIVSEEFTSEMVRLRTGTHKYLFIFIRFCTFIYNVN